MKKNRRAPNAREASTGAEPQCRACDEKRSAGGLTQPERRTSDEGKDGVKDELRTQAAGVVDEDHRAEHGRDVRGAPLPREGVCAGSPCPDAGNSLSWSCTRSVRTPMARETFLDSLAQETASFLFVRYPIPALRSDPGTLCCLSRLLAQSPVCSTVIRRKPCARM